MPSRNRSVARLASAARAARQRLANGRTPTSDEAPRPSLNEIGLRTGTDKASTIHDYLGVYEAGLRRDS